MSRHELVLDIDSKSDAHAVRLLLEQLHNVLREEFREPGGPEATPRAVLQSAAELRDASRKTAPGSLTITLEQDDGDFTE